MKENTLLGTVGCFWHLALCSSLNTRKPPLYFGHTGRMEDTTASDQKSPTAPATSR